MAAEFQSNQVVVDGTTPEGRKCIHEMASAIIAYARALQKYADAMAIKSQQKQVVPRTNAASGFDNK